LKRSSKALPKHTCKIREYYNFGVPDSDKLLFHVDEAMSWESVRNLQRMKSTLLLVQNVISQSDVSEEIVVCLGDVRESLEEVFLAVDEGAKFGVG